MLAVVVMVVMVVNRDCSGPSCDFPNAVLQIHYTADTRAGWQPLRPSPPSEENTRARVRARARARAMAIVRAGRSRAGWRHLRPPCMCVCVCEWVCGIDDV